MLNMLNLKINCLNIILFIFLLSFNILAQNIESNKTDKCDKALSDCYTTILRDLSPRLIERFGVDIHEIELIKLEILSKELRNNPKSIGFIIVYGGKINKYDEFKIRTDRMLIDLKFMGIDKNRIRLVRGGYREKFEFELWISPSEKIFPPITPTISPEKVRYKGRMKPFGI